MGGVGGEKIVYHIAYTGQLISIEKCYKYVQVQGPNTLSQMDTPLEFVWFRSNVGWSCYFGLGTIF